MHRSRAGLTRILHKERGALQIIPEIPGGSKSLVLPVWLIFLGRQPDVDKFKAYYIDLSMLVAVR